MSSRVPGRYFSVHISKLKPIPLLLKVLVLPYYYSIFVSQKDFEVVERIAHKDPYNTGKRGMLLDFISGMKHHVRAFLTVAIEVQ